MDKYKYYDTLVIDNDNNRIFLCHADAIREVVYADTTDGLVTIDENGYADSNIPDTLYEEDFDYLYYLDDKGEHEFVLVEDSWGEDQDKHRFNKAEFGDYEHCIELNSEHGIRQEYYEITNAEIIPCDVFKADGYVPQDYPHQQYEAFFKVVSEEDRKIYYVKMTSPFFPDENDDAFELTDRETFEKYES